jgi:hypothetical protein
LLRGPGPDSPSDDSEQKPYGESKEQIPSDLPT